MDKVTAHTFSRLGLRIVPFKSTNIILRRDEKGAKEFYNTKTKEVVPNRLVYITNWVQHYGDYRKEFRDTSIAGVVCGSLKNTSFNEVAVIALDCDNAQAWDMFVALDPSYKFRYASIGKDGGTIIYKLPEELRDVTAYSIDDEINFEFMALRENGANAKVYLPTTANETKEKIPKGAELTLPPKTVITLIKLLKPKKPSRLPENTNISTNVKMVKTLPFNQPLVKQFILESKANATKGSVYGKVDSLISRRIYTITTPKKFRDLSEYKENGWLHPNSKQISNYPQYIIGVSAIVGADMSISPEDYVEFMQVVNLQLDNPYNNNRYLEEIINPMLHGKAKIEGSMIWRYNENWNAKSHTVVNEYGDSLEYFISADIANRFIEYNHQSKTTVVISSLRNMLDRIYTVDSDVKGEKPTVNLVKKLKLASEKDDLRSEAGIFTDDKGRININAVNQCKNLQILRNPPETPPTSGVYIEAFNIFLTHLFDGDEESITYLKQIIACHGRNLTSISVIIYMVGVGGAGKSKFAKMLEKIFGTNATRRPQAQQLTGRFNDFLANCALLIISEADEAKHRDREGIKQILKTVTGEDTMDLESKHQSLTANIPIFALPVLLSNSLWYQEDTADRRLFAVNPAHKLINSPEVVKFESKYSVNITDVIFKGIDLGIITQYLTSYYVDKLPEVPITRTKQAFSNQQSNPIDRVKSLIMTESHDQLFDLFEEFEITSFFTYLKNAKHTPSYCRNHLMELVKEMREGDLHPTNKVISHAFTPNNWLEMQDYVRNNTNSTGSMSYKIVGRYKWTFKDLKERLDEWEKSKLEVIS